MGTSAFNGVTLLVGRQEGHLACKGIQLVETEHWCDLTGALHVVEFSLAPAPL